MCNYINVLTDYISLSLYQGIVLHSIIILIYKINVIIMIQTIYNIVSKTMTMNYVATPTIMITIQYTYNMCNAIKISLPNN